MLKRTVKAETSPGRLNGSGPIAIVDIGSNSVRLVVYERLARTPTMLFNEKVLAGLGRGVSTTGRLSEDSIARTLTALTRFRRISDQAEVVDTHVIATAAARDAENGSDFIRDVEAVLGTSVRILSGREEAQLAASGVCSGVWKPEGIVGDLGGGSLELVSVTPGSTGEGTTLPLGVIRLEDEAGASIRSARRIASSYLVDNAKVPPAEGKNLYLIGGTWRSLARLHMVRRNYPLPIMHQYRLAAREALTFCDLVMEADLETMPGSEHVSRQRRPFLPYGAAVLSEVIRVTQPSEIVLSSLGVREGLLFDLLDAETRTVDPLVASAGELGYLRARAPSYGGELINWTSQLIETLNHPESEWDARMRTAACLLSDVSWRAHPDHRAEACFSTISNANFVGLDHAGRAFLATCGYFRHAGPDEPLPEPYVAALIGPDLIDRARMLGVAFRVAHLICASMPGLLAGTRFEMRDGALWLLLPSDLAELDGERLDKRLGQLSRLVNAECRVVAMPPETV